MEGWQVRATRMAGAVCERAVWPLEAPGHLPGCQHAPSRACKVSRMPREGHAVLGFAFSGRRGAVCSLLAGEGHRSQSCILPWGMSPPGVDAGEGDFLLRPRGKGIYIVVACRNGNEVLSWKKATGRPRDKLEWREAEWGPGLEVETLRVASTPVLGDVRQAQTLWLPHPPDTVKMRSAGASSFAWRHHQRSLKVHAVHGDSADRAKCNITSDRTLSTGMRLVRQRLTLNPSSAFAACALKQVSPWMVQKCSRATWLQRVITHHVC